MTWSLDPAASDCDPGWQRALSLGIVGFLIFPVLLPRGVVKVNDGLIALRTLWVSYLTTDLAVLLVGAVVAPTLKSALPTAVAVVGVLVMASLAFVMGPLLARKPTTGPTQRDLTPSQ
jgi:hypothetical protein